MVIGLQGGIFAEQRAAIGVFNVVFNRHHAVFADLAENLEQQGQQIHVERFGELGTLEQGRQRTQCGLQCLAVIADNERTDGATKNHQYFKGLPQGSQMPTCQRIPPEHGRQDHNIPYDY